MSLLHKLLGHKFKPRYSVTHNAESIQAYTAGFAISSQKQRWSEGSIIYCPESVADRIYECDVCVRCGEIRKP